MIMTAPTQPEPPTTGPEAILAALSAINIDELEAEQMAIIKSGVKTKRDRAVRLLNIVRGLRKNELRPDQLMISSVPVIPPKFRPFSVTGDTFLPGDSNEVYRDVMEFRRLYKDTEKSLGRDGAADAYLDMAKAVKAAYGFGDSPNPKTAARSVKGFFNMVTGTNPKTGFYNQKLLAKPVDTVGRGVIVPDADLGMDEVGVPVDMAWKLYGNYVQRNLVRGGMSPAVALKHIMERSPMAKHALDYEMGDTRARDGRWVPRRPVVITRSPAWHRTNVTGQRARIVDGDAIRLNTFVSEGHNADFDGDEVHNQVVTAIPRHLISSLPSYLVDRFQILGNSADMQNRLQLPYIDPVTHEIAVIDLEDFPHSEELIGEKQGTNSYIRFFKALPGTKVIAFDEEAQTLVWADVAGWSEHTAPPIEVVTLSNRRQTFTDDDPRAVYGMNPATGEMGRWTPTSALEKQVAVPCGRNLRELVSTLVPITEVNVGDMLCPLDFDTGWFLGALCGDGWWDKKDWAFYTQRGWKGLRNLHLADLKEDNATRLKQFIATRLDPGGTLYYHRHEQKKGEGDARYGDTVKHSFNFAGSGPVAAFLQTHLGGDRDENTAGSGNKRVPGFLFRAPEEFRRGFLCGMVDTDGSISVKPDKTDGGGIMFSVGSTSLRLIRELQALCMTLDVRASVTWSKDTSGGNECWLLVLSAWDCKRLDLFSDLATSYKRDNFIAADVIRENTAAVFNKAVVPRIVFDIVQSDLIQPKISKEERANPDAAVEWKKHQQNMAVQWSKAKSEGVISRPSARRVLEHLQELHSQRVAARDAALTLLRSEHVEMTPTNIATLRAGIYATIAPFSADHAKGSLTYKLASIVNTAAHEGGVLGELRRKRLLSRLEALPAYRGAIDSELLKTWVRDILDQEHITWATVVEVQKTGIHETGYDLTVPGYETFMSADGVILSNTMSVHVPSTEAAVRDVQDKLMASNMLWSIKDRSKTMANPKHEQIVGFAMQRPEGSEQKIHKFHNEDDAMAAIERGDVDLYDDVEIEAPA